MLQLTISGGSEEGSTELFIDYQQDLVVFTVCTASNKQYDFNIEKHEWEILKKFIDNQIEKNHDNP